ncbi:motilin receptor [Ambystoma mexicanum]|uniref:motilin receptor n=1 Tax=Ambystoma mexicanum TaxID=8296 RepID=UPI0037E71A93
MTVVCVILLVVGVIGNTVTIIIIRKYKEMKTTTNLYLSSMAASDLVILFCLPFDFYRLWKSRSWFFGDFLCRFFNFISEGCTYATILHITALSVERYLAICFPLKAKVFITKRRVKVVVVLLWAFALISAGPFFFMAGSEPGFSNDSLNLSVGWECKTSTYARDSGLLNIMLWVTTSYFFIPMFCLCILYGFIGRTLWSSKDRIRGPNAANREKSHRQTVKILAVVVLSFVICWLPFHIGRILFSNTADIRMLYISQYFNIVALVLFYLSACINPILYNLISKKYRTAAYKLLRSSATGERTFTVTREDTGAYTETSASVHNDYVTPI